MLRRMLGLVEDFQRDVIGYPIPERPQLLPKKRLKARLEHLREEVGELELSKTLEDQADACVDIAYLALGALCDMGVLPGPAFDEVHRANMDKYGAPNPARPDGDGYDAVKPEGWRPPDHVQFFHVTRKDLDVLANLSPVLREVTELRVKKGNDYNAGVPLSAYFPFDHESYSQMIYLKGLRLVSLVKLLRAGKKAMFEGIYDTVLDCINYAVFYGEWLTERREKAREDLRAAQ